MCVFLGAVGWGGRARAGTLSWLSQLFAFDWRMQPRGLGATLVPLVVSVDAAELVCSRGCVEAIFSISLRNSELLLKLGD